MGKTAKKKSAANKKKPPVKKADVDLKEARQKVKNAIGEKAEELAVAVAREAVQKAQAQPMKILFEMIGLFPESDAERAAAADDQSLAKTLLDRLGLSDEALEGDDGPVEHTLREEPAEALIAPGNPVK